MTMVDVGLVSARKDGNAPAKKEKKDEKIR